MKQVTSLGGFSRMSSAGTRRPPPLWASSSLQAPLIVWEAANKIKKNNVTSSFIRIHALQLYWRAFPLVIFAFWGMLWLIRAPWTSADKHSGDIRPDIASPRPSGVMSLSSLLDSSSHSSSDGSGWKSDHDWVLRTEQGDPNFHVLQCCAGGQR